MAPSATVGDGRAPDALSGGTRRAGRASIGVICPYCGHMPSPRRSPLLSAVPRAVVCVALLGALAGCGDDTPETPAEPAPATTPATTPTTTEPTTPAPTPPESFDSLTDRLLATDAVPGLNDEWDWRDGDIGPADADAFGVCARFDLSSIGATDVVQRTWYAPDDSDDSAAQQIADFPDEATAARAAAVLRSWHKKCRGTVEGARVKVGKVTPVPTDAGTSYWYLVSWVPPGSDDLGRFHAFGTVVDGTRISVLRMDNSGQDYNYEAGQEPMAEMVRAAAPRLR